MDRFCVITNSDKDSNYETANFVKEFLESKGKQCVITKNVLIKKADWEGYTDVTEIPEDTECAIVLGGDGTIIQAANDLAYKDIPILGVNLGTLGFLTAIEKQDVESALLKLFDNRCVIENRMMLKGEVYCDDKKITSSFALNDFVVGKRGFFRLISIQVYVNEELVDTYIADGIIISTPTGSTGYNLSAGGPVLAPDIKAMIITPICPHSLNNRSLVVSAEDKIVLKIGRSKARQPDEAVTISDGRMVMDIKTGDRIEITKAVQETKIVKLTDTSFFDRLRNKLGQDKDDSN
jgi:NAD+ kinase